MNNNSLLGLRESIRTGRVEAIWDVPFTDPVTYGLRVRGGAIFDQGIVVGDNDTFVPGAVRFRDNDLQFRRFDGWTKIPTFPISGFVDNVILVGGSDGEITGSQVFLEDKNLTNLDLVETGTITGQTGIYAFIDSDIISGNTGAFNFIDSDTIVGITGKFSSLIPNSGSLAIGNALLNFPNVDGATGEALLTNGDRDLSFGRVPVYNTDLSGISGDRMIATIPSTNPYEVQVMKFSPTADRGGITGTTSLSTNVLYTDRIETGTSGSAIVSHSDISVLDSQLTIFSPVNSEVKVDQSQIDGTNPTTNPLSQPFVPTSSGRLTQVTINTGFGLTGIGEETISWQVKIYTGQDGPDGGTLLGSSAIHTVRSSIIIVNELITFDNFDQIIQITSGSTYSIYIVVTEHSQQAIPLVRTKDSAVVGFLELREKSGGSWADTGKTTTFSYTQTGPVIEKPIIFLADPPVNSSDAGDTGAVSWDDDYFYLKTGTGWGRLQWDKAF